MVNQTANEPQARWGSQHYAAAELGAAIGSVSIIVAARNCAEWLAQAIHSCFWQSEQPIEVIYVDDGSTDGSLEIAEAMAKVTDRLHVLKAPGGDVALARNLGAVKAKGDYLVFLDGDDQLSSDFMSECVAALEENPLAPFAYTESQCFGESGRRFGVPDVFDVGLLWRKNYCHTSAMVRRCVFQQVGGWRHMAGSWDWDLWLRCQRLGTPVKAEATLLYRRHRHNHSSRLTDRADLHEQIRRINTRVVAVGALSGRMGSEFTAAWLDAVIENMECFGDQAKLLLFANSMCQIPVDQLAQRNVEIVHVPHAATGEGLSVLLSAIYNRALVDPCELKWFVEDDVMPAPYALQYLAEPIFRNCAPAAAGWYRSRHDPDRFVAHHLRGKAIVNAEPNGKPHSHVDLTGTGCLAVFGPWIKHRFAPEFIHNGKSYPAHDWHFTSRIPGGVLMDSNVQCRHYQTEGSWV